VLETGGSAAGVLSLGALVMAFTRRRKREHTAAGRGGGGGGDGGEPADLEDPLLLKGAGRESLIRAGCPETVLHPDERAALLEYLLKAVKRAQPQHAEGFQRQCEGFGRGESSAADYMQWLDQNLGCALVDHVMRALLQLLRDGRKRQLLSNAYARQRDGGAAHARPRIAYSRAPAPQEAAVAAVAAAAPQCRMAMRESITEDWEGAGMRGSITADRAAAEDRSWAQGGGERGGEGGGRPSLGGRLRESFGFFNYVPSQGEEAAPMKSQRQPAAGRSGRYARRGERRAGGCGGSSASGSSVSGGGGSSSRSSSRRGSRRPSAAGTPAKSQPIATSASRASFASDGVMAKGAAGSFGEF
jgi:hypothetical protein